MSAPNFIMGFRKEMDLLLREGHGFEHRTLVRALETTVQNGFAQSRDYVTTAQEMFSLTGDYSTLAAGAMQPRLEHELESAREAGWLTGRVIRSGTTWRMRRREDLLAHWRTLLFSWWVSGPSVNKAAWMYGLLAALDESWSPPWSVSLPLVGASSPSS